MRRVCITIDTEFPDRPCRDPLRTLDGVLEALAAHGVTASFFVVGSWARANPQRVAQIQAGGHLIGNHSYSHCNLARLSAQGIVDDLEECRQVLAELGVETRPWFRAPYGEMTSRNEVRSAIGRAGYRHIPWQVDGGDWREGASPAALADAAFAEIKRRWPRTSTVLLHSWPDVTAPVLSALLARLSDSRARFLTVGQIRTPLLRRAAAPLGRG